jgi:hypothetical protein
MARTNSAAVQALLVSDYDTVNTPSLTPYIDTAASVIDDVVDCAARKGITMSDAKLELLERWMAAHFYCVMDKPYSSKSTSGASGSFHGQTAQGFSATLYGQQAMRIDTSGCLYAIDETRVAGGFWMGKRPTEQTNYRDRR